MHEKKNDFHLNNDNDLIPKRCVPYNNGKKGAHWKIQRKKLFRSGLENCRTEKKVYFFHLYSMHMICEIKNDKLVYLIH